MLQGRGSTGSKCTESPFDEDLVRPCRRGEDRAVALGPVPLWIAEEGWLFARGKYRGLATSGDSRSL